VPNLDAVVDYLNDQGTLQLDPRRSPWPTYAEDEDVFLVDWDQLFPNLDQRDELDDADGRDVTDGIERAIARETEPAVGPGDGWDICGWYQPVHFFGYDCGIFLRQQCLRRITVQLAHFLPRTTTVTPPLKRALRLAATYSVFLHEHFHHKVESAAIRMQVIDPRGSFYLPYSTNVYQPALDTDDLLEEALANADAYGRIAKDRYRRAIGATVAEAVRQYLKWRYTNEDPPGYRRGADFLTPSTFAHGLGDLLSRVHEGVPSPVRPSDDWQLAPGLSRSLWPVTSDLWVVVPVGSHPVLPVKAVAATCSTREMVRILETQGKYEVVKGAGKGSHVRLARSGAQPVTLPGDRKDLTPGAARTALRAVNARLSDLPELIRKSR
jgi:predicted RNA binding protein YcfA (HicA-like mRNA interferase family)